MAWDETPLYERNREPVVETDKSLNIVDIKTRRQYVPWSSEIKDRMRTEPRAKTVSIVAAWYEREKAKQANREENEIDINEIRIAMKGVKNKWYNYIKDNSITFDYYFQGKANWQDILDHVDYVDSKNRKAI